MTAARPVRPGVLGGTGALLAAILLSLALFTPALAKLGDLKVSLEPRSLIRETPKTDGPCGLSGRQLAVMFPRTA